MISKHKIVIFYAGLTPMTQTLILDKELRTLFSQFIGGLDRSIAQSSTDTVKYTVSNKVGRKWTSDLMA
jgi:hypothetical protein